MAYGGKLKMWPFRRRAKRESGVHLQSFTLTKEEEEECRTLFRSLFPEQPDGSWFVKEDIADEFHRSWIAFALIGRAERLCAMGSAEEACRSAAKACAVYPLFIYFYDFACILDEVRKKDEARAMFGECLRLYDLKRLTPMDEVILKQRDVEAALQHARRVVS